MSHGAGPYFIKNVIIAFLNLEVKFLMPQSIWTTTQPGLQKLETAASLLGQRKTGCEVSFHYFRFVSKYDHLHHAIIIRSSNLIGDLKSEIGPASCDKKCCSEHQTPFARARGCGQETRSLHSGSGNETNYILDGCVATRHSLRDYITLPLGISVL